MKHKQPRISIIIPVLNEQGYIKKVLQCINTNSQSQAIAEILVIDGGSTDATAKEAEAAGAKVHQAPRGRANQMNLGAQLAIGDILYFLHVDTLPPIGFDTAILASYSQGFSAGCFRLRFDSRNVVLKCFAWFTRINHHLCRGGDQSLYVSKALFVATGGFNEDYLIYEDNEYIKRLYQQATFTVLPSTVQTSARRYEQKGVLRLQYHFGIVHLKHYLGAKPQVLHAYYKRHIAV